MRNQLNKQYRDDNRQALDHLTKLKGEEMEEMRKYLKKQIAQLTEKVLYFSKVVTFSSRERL